MCLSTSNKHTNQPSGRMVLLKDFDERFFIFILALLIKMSFFFFFLANLCLLIEDLFGLQIIHQERQMIFMIIHLPH